MPTAGGESVRQGRLSLRDSLIRRGCSFVCLTLAGLLLNSVAYSEDHDQDPVDSEQTAGEPGQAEEVDEKPKISGLYAGGGLVLARIGITEVCNDFGYGVNCRNNSGGREFSGTFHVGYRINRIFGLEFGRTDYRTLRFDDNAVFQPGLNDFFNTDVTLDLRGTQVAALFTAPWENWEGYLKGGINIIDASSVQVLQPLGSGDIITRTIDDNTAEFLFGAGLGYSFGGFSHIRAEFNVTDLSSNLLAAEPDSGSRISAFTLEYQFRFGRGWRPR